MPLLTTEQKRELCLILSIGCSRDTAARYAGCLPEEINAAILSDAEFARDIARAEAGIELAHMRAVQRASQDERHWRASVWWLERRRPAHYARRSADAVSPAELKTVLVELGGAIAREVTSPQDRARLLTRLHQIATNHDNGELPAVCVEIDRNEAPRAELD